LSFSAENLRFSGKVYQSGFVKILPFSSQIVFISSSRKIFLKCKKIFGIMKFKKKILQIIFSAENPITMVIYGILSIEQIKSFSYHVYEYFEA